MYKEKVLKNRVEEKHTFKSDESSKEFYSFFGNGTANFWVAPDNRNKKMRLAMKLYENGSKIFEMDNKKSKYKELLLKNIEVKKGYDYRMKIYNRGKERGAFKIKVNGPDLKGRYEEQLKVCTIGDLVRQGFVRNEKYDLPFFLMRRVFAEESKYKVELYINDKKEDSIYLKLKKCEWRKDIVFKNVEFGRRDKSIEIKVKKDDEYIYQEKWYVNVYKEISSFGMKTNVGWVVDTNVEEALMNYEEVNQIYKGLDPGISDNLSTVGNTATFAGFVALVASKKLKTKVYKAMFNSLGSYATVIGFAGLLFHLSYTSSMEEAFEKALDSCGKNQTDILVRKETYRTNIGSKIVTDVIYRFCEKNQ